MTDIRMYCTDFCPYCVRAEMLLKSKGVENLTKILVDSIPDGFKDMIEQSHHDPGGRRKMITELKNYLADWLGDEK